MDGVADGSSFINCSTMNETCSYCEQPIARLCIVCRECADLKLCKQCFSLHVEPPGHRRSHSYRIQLGNDALRLFDDSDWSVSEDLQLLNAIEIFGYGNWKDISTYMETRSPEDCSARFEKFLRSSCGRLLLSRYASNSARKLAAIDHTMTSRGAGSSLSPCSCSHFGLTPSPTTSSLLTARTSSAYEPLLNNHLNAALTPRVTASNGNAVETSLDHRDSALLGYMPLCDYFEYDYDDEADELLNAIDLADDSLGVRLALASASMSGPPASKLSLLGAKLGSQTDGVTLDDSMRLLPAWSKLGLRVNHDASKDKSSKKAANAEAEDQRQVSRVRRLLQLVSIDIYQRRIRERAIRRAILAREHAHAKLLDTVLKAAGSCSHAVAAVEEEEVVIRPRSDVTSSQARKAKKIADANVASSSSPRKKRAKENDVSAADRLVESLKTARSVNDWRSLQSRLFNRLTAFARFSKPAERARLVTAITRISWLKRRIAAILAGCAEERDSLSEPPAFEPPKAAVRRTSLTASNRPGAASSAVAAADAIRRKRRRHKQYDGYYFDRRRKKARPFKALFGTPKAASDRE